MHLGKRKQDPTLFDLQRLAEVADGFSGAEIEQAIVSALYESFASKQALSTALIIAEIERTRPLSVIMAEKIDYLRAWATERAVSAG